MGKFMLMLLNPHPVKYSPHLTDKETGSKSYPQGIIGQNGELGSDLHLPASTHHCSPPANLSNT